MDAEPAPGVRTGPVVGSAFVGRDREMGELLAGLDDALSGRGRLFLLSGEPGIGKTRLADEVAAVARERDARVLWGRCWEAGGAPAYWPWVQSIRSYMRDRDQAALRRELGIGAADLAHMLPEIREVFPDISAAPALDPESARFRLFDSTAAFLGRASEAQALVLVLDDLHAADEPSLLLLEFVGSQLAEMHLLIIGGYRDIDPTLDNPLLATVSQLARQRLTRRLALLGLTEADVSDFIRMASGIEARKGLVSAIHRETEGNPLFVGEIVRLLASEGRLSEEAATARLTLPEGAREVIGRRLARLSEECRRVLSLGSILGREFGLDAVARLAGLSQEDVVRVLDEAAAVRVVTEVPGSPGRLRFAHALIRDAAYTDLSPAQRLELHWTAGVVLETLHAHDPEPHLAEIAHHFFEAAPGRDPQRAIDYARRAGDRASALLAYEEAVRLYRMALQTLDLKGDSDPESRCVVLLALGDAQMKAGDGPGSQETFLQAAEIAKRAGLREAFARAALGYGGRFVWTRAGRDRRVVPVLEEVLSAIGDVDTALRARTLARLGGALRGPDAHRERRDRVSAEAVEIARRVGDPPTLAYALVGRYTAIWGPDNLEELRAIAEEIMRIAESSGDQERAIEGRLLRHNINMTIGDIAGARADLDAAGHLADELHQVLQRWYVSSYRTTLALQEGRFEEGEGLIAETLALGERAEAMGAQFANRLQLYVLRREQGRLAEMEEVIKASIDEFPWYPLFRGILAHLHSELGREAEARREFETLAEHGFAALPKDNEWLFGMTFLPEVAAFLGDGPRAAVLYDLLVPYAELNSYSQPEVGTGPVGRYLGILAATMSRYREAADHFERAATMAERTGARPWLAWTWHDSGRALLSRDGPGDRDRAIELLTDAAATAHELGMAALGKRVSALLADLGPAAGVGEGQEKAGRRPTLFRREGEYWAIAFEGDGFRLRDTKGLRYIAQLLANPGREIHALDLAAEGTAPSEAAQAREEGLELTGEGFEILDSRARRAYKERLQELELELSEAESFHDFERGDQLRDEMEFIARELSGATGLGGRSRQAGSPAERARQSVTKAVKVALERIGKHSPTLCKHLESTIHTGTFCSYTPDPRVPIAWSL